jgi:hypothetical protein
MATPPIRASDYYKDFIRDSSNTISESNLLLPFYHTCRGETFRTIASSGSVAATHCKEFQENLLYLFYGRPAYRIAGEKTTLDLGQFPVCFILKRDSVRNVKRIFPFDTGAFLANILREYCGDFHTEAEAMAALLEYELGADLNNLAKFIGLVYGDDDHYLTVAPAIKASDLKGMCFELSRILDMASARSRKEWDNRALTAEIQMMSSISFDGVGIEAVVLPTQFISHDTNLQSFFYSEGIEVIDYNVSRMKPENATELIERSLDTYRVGNP